MRYLGSGSNESKTVFIDSMHWSHPADQPVVESPDTSMVGLYYLYIFSLHGFYFEALYEDQESAQSRSRDQDAVVASHPVNDETKARDDVPGSSDSAAPPELSETTAASFVSGGSVSTSADLLRRLLFLRKKRQLAIAALPPPEILEGAKVTNVRTASVAETLKSKVRSLSGVKESPLHATEL